MNVQIQQAEAVAQQETEVCRGYAQKMQQLVVVSEEHYQQVGVSLLQISDKIKALDKQRKEFVGPLNKVVKNINAFFKTPLDEYTKAKDILKRAMGSFQAEQARIRQDALQAAALAAAPPQQIAATAQESAQQKQTFNTLMQQASTHAAPVAPGTQTRVAWKYRVNNFAEIPDEYKMLDETKTRKIVQAMKEDTKIPGLEVWSETTVVPTGR